MTSMTQDSSIAAALRDDILRGQYRCGERLPSERDLVDQTLEAMSGFLALAARLGIERANDALREEFLSILDEMLKSDTPDTPRTELFSMIADRFVLASGNTVLHIVRHGLWTRYAEYAVPDYRRPVGQSKIEPSLRRLEQSIRDRVPAVASEAIYDLTAVIQNHNRLARKSEGNITRNATGKTNSSHTGVESAR